MLILRPIPHETIWGGDKLKPYTEEKLPKIGHLYSLFDDEKGSSNLILNGPEKGKRFHEFFLENREKYGLQSFSHFPLVIALVEAKESLSIQVHPDDECARALEGAAWGKNESWYFLDPPSSGSIYCGCSAKSTEEVRELVAADRIEDVTALLPVETGDYVYVPAGTLHAMREGSLVYEIEENSEYTYRFYDFKRKDAAGNLRELHVEKALQALKTGNRPAAARYEDAPEGIRERMYTTKLLQGLDAYRNESETLEVVTILDPSADVTLEGVRMRMGTSAVLLPGEEMPLCGCRAMTARPRG